MKYIFVFIISLFLFIIFNIIKNNNSSIITVNYIIHEIKCPIYILISISIVLGFTISFLIFFFKYIYLLIKYNRIKKNNLKK
ncbi:lipopolysaccharide assembly protein LapA domain-containing protein [Buchnera aphidicola]|uniref:lipopolysaccharide assembly protein LapA domain-containing protein n=1 Tax=Buchnera aphidicola TaxID=9 RepID=UPI003D1896DC